ncbi:hypothetical protein LIER_20001 [Lithospermum erythrorhizon]|uniref:PGG domain-containing protein n=1 Tax=Lithospermum erythrorhizon TaxID=34254 RepID=A0AAV3QJY4_LITER
MEQMVKNLYEAAIEGNVARLNDLIQQDELILERCNVVTCYDESPLHIASMIGHLDFCSELVSRNHELVLEVDSRRSSALHLASAKGHKEIVIVLVSAHPEMCLAYDGDGYNPIHITAICRLNGFERIVGDKQVEIIEYLVSQTSIDVDTLNSDGLTAPDVLRLQARRDSKYMDIVHFLQRISPVQTSSSSLLPGHHQTEIKSQRRKDHHVSFEKQHNSLMVVASLIATMAFQAGVNPPSGFNNGANDSQLPKSFVVSNTVAFLSSLSVILLLINGLPLRHKVFTWTWTAIMWISITAITCTYTISLASMPKWEKNGFSFSIVIATWFDSMAMLFLVHTTRFLSQRIEDWHLEHKCCL